MPVGIVALSYAKRVREPNPVNEKLAAITDEIDKNQRLKGKTTVVVAQWEVALALTIGYHYLVTPEHATVKGSGKRYLDSEDVLKKAYEVFRSYGVTEVIVIANTFLHRGVVESKVRSAGFKVVKIKIPSVGFDPSPLNLQWWCKGPVHTLIYTGLLVIGKLIGKDFHGIWEKPAT